MLTGQVFAIMSGTATQEQVKEITKASDAYLYDEKIGGYKLNTDFKEIKTDLGRMFGFAYGSCICTYGSYVCQCFISKKSCKRRL